MTLQVKMRLPRRAEIAQAYLAASTHVYGTADAPQMAARQFEERIAAVDALIHPQDDREKTEEDEEP